MSDHKDGDKGADSQDEAAPAEVTKESIRRDIWRHMERNNLARFPRPVFYRIPNFRGSDEACDKAAELEEFRDAGVINCNPDKPQQQIRFRALEMGKRLIVPTPKLSEGLFNELTPPDDSKETLRICSTAQGVREHSKPVGLNDHIDVDLVIMGSVAVSTDGLRLGKGDGYGDLEWAIMYKQGAVSQDTKVVAVVHDCQVVDIPQHLTKTHDAVVDMIVTQTEIIHCPKQKKPTEVIWSLLHSRRVADMPILQKLREQDREAGLDVTLKDEVEGYVEEDDEQERRPQRRRRNDNNQRPRRRRGDNRKGGDDDGEHDQQEGGRDSSGDRRPPRRDRRRRRRTQSGEEEQREDGAHSSDKDGDHDDAPRRRNRKPRRSNNSRRKDRSDEGEENERDGSEDDRHDEDHDKKRRGGGGGGGGGRRQRRYDDGDNGPRTQRVRRRDPLPSVFVGNLPRGVRVRDFKDEVRGRDVLPLRVIWRGGRAFLLFQDQAEIEDAMEKLAGLQIDGQDVRVEVGKGRPQRPASDSRRGRGRSSGDEGAGEDIDDHQDAA